LLQVTRAELHGMQYDMQRDPSANAQMAAQWLRAAALLAGMAGDLVREMEYPITANRHAACAKLLAAFEALEASTALLLAENYPLPDDLGSVVGRIHQHLIPPESK